MSRAHDNMMSEYHCAREAQEQRAEQYSSGYETELKEFYESVEERITFKSFLIGRKSESNV